MDKVNVYLATRHKGFGKKHGYHIEVLVLESEQGEELGETAKANDRKSRRIEDVTENRLAAVGLLEALKRLRRPCDLMIVSDNRHIVNCINNAWINKWKQNDFRAANGEQVKNADVWREIAEHMEKHLIEIRYMEQKTKYYDWQQFEMRKQEEMEEKTC